MRTQQELVCLALEQHVRWHKSNCAPELLRRVGRAERIRLVDLTNQLREEVRAYLHDPVLMGELEQILDKCEQSLLR